MTTDSIISDFSDYLIYERRLSDKTREAYSRELKNYLLYLSRHNLQVDKILPSQMEEYLIARKNESSLENCTISRIVATLRTFYKYLESKEYIDSNPATLVDRPRIHEHLPKILSESDVDRILDAMKTDDDLGIRDWCLFEVIYSSGLRISEAVSLDLSSYLEDENSMRVFGKRGKERVVFLGERAKDALNLYLSDVRPRLLSKKNKKEPALFINRRGERMTRQAMHKRYHEVVERLGLDATVHTLRHSFASHMMMNGADVRSVQEMLGHSDIRTTQIYTHFNTSSLLSLFDKFSPLSDDDI